MLGISAMCHVRLNVLIYLILKGVLFQHGIIINNVSKPMSTLLPCSFQLYNQINPYIKVQYCKHAKSV